MAAPGEASAARASRDVAPASGNAPASVDAPASGNAPVSVDGPASGVAPISDVAKPKATVRSHVRVSRACADFWLNTLFVCCRRTPWLTRGARGFFLRGAWACAPSLRSATTANARRILGPAASAANVRRVARGIIASFYDFVCDVGASLSQDRARLVGRIAAVHGHEHYLAARRDGAGAVVVTAHMGSFEVGVAALLEHDPIVHVVFKRDAIARFEQLRSRLHRSLGVRESPVDEGWGIWIRLRDALKRNEVVVVQGDRLMPGQRGLDVAVLGATMSLPTGPAKLALASGAPIVPIYSIRRPDGRIELFVEPAIRVGAGDDPDKATAQLARILERYLLAYPDQWLMIQPAWCEDQSPDTVPAAGSK